MRNAFKKFEGWQLQIDPGRHANRVYAQGQGHVATLSLAEAMFAVNTRSTESLRMCLGPAFYRQSEDRLQHDELAERQTTYNQLAELLKNQHGLTHLDLACHTYPDPVLNSLAMCNVTGRMHRSFRTHVRSQVWT